MTRIKLFVLLFCIVIVNKVSAQSETEIIKKANDFVETKKYETAFKLLETFDPKNEKPDIVLLKEDIALKYFVTNMMAQMFAFKDLEPNEDVMDYRGKQGSFSIHVFSIDSALIKLIKVYPRNYKLYRGLADFYYDTQLRYEGRWLISDSLLTDLTEKNYQVAIDHNQADYKTCYNMAMEFLADKKNKEAVPYFLKSIGMKGDFADAHYNLAYAYLFIDDRKNALTYAKKSLDLYKDNENKGDAARMTGEIYVELKDEKNAMKYYELANETDSANYYNLKPLLSLYVHTGNDKAAETLDAFYNLAPEKPTIYNDLDDIYYNNKKSPDLVSFYKGKLDRYKDNKKVLGNLYFYLARLCLETDKKVAKEYFTKVRDIFAAIYDPDNPVFDAIKKGIQEAER